MERPRVGERTRPTSLLRENVQDLLDTVVTGTSYTSEVDLDTSGENVDLSEKK